MATLETGTLQGSTSAALLETGTVQGSSFVELETGTLQGSDYTFELTTGTLQNSRVIAQDLVDTFIVPESDRWNTAVSGISSKLVLPKTVVRFKLINNGVETDLTPYLLRCSITRRHEGKATFTASFIQHSPAGFDDDGYPLEDLWARMQIKQSDLNPLFLGRNDMTNKILSHRYDRSRQAVITMDFHTEQGVQTWRAPTFLLGTPRLTKEGILEWSGEGILTLLEREGQYRDDIVPGDNILNYAHATTREICAAHGINTVVIDYPDYPVRQLRMSSGTPRQWIEAMAEPDQALVREEGDGLVIRPAPQITAGAQWAWVDYLNIMGLEVEQTEGWKNKFTLTRLRDQAAVLSDDGPQVCRGEQCVGTQTVTVSEPSNFVVIYVKRRGNATLRFENFQPLDEFGNAIMPATNAQSFASATKIHSIRFDSVPFYLGANQQQTQGVSGGGPSTLSGNNTNDPAALNQYVPEYEWIIFGGSEATATAEAVDAFNEAFSFQASDSATQALWGEIPEGEAIEMSVIPNGTVGQRAVTALLYANVRMVFKLTFSTPYVNPWADPGDIHSITHYRTSQTAVPWICEEDTINFNDDKTLVQSFVMHRGLI